MFIQNKQKQFIIKEHTVYNYAIFIRKAISVKSNYGKHKVTSMKIEIVVQVTIAIVDIKGSTQFRKTLVAPLVHSAATAQGFLGLKFCRLHWTSNY